MEPNTTLSEACPPLVSGGKIIVSVLALLLSMVVGAILYLRNNIIAIVNDDRNDIKALGFKIKIGGLELGISHLKKANRSATQSSVGASQIQPHKSTNSQEDHSKANKNKDASRQGSVMSGDRLKTKSKPRLLGHKEKTYPWEISFNEVKILSKLGEGSFGTVHKGSWCGTTVAIKRPVKGIPVEHMEKFIDEVQIMTLFHHPNIVIFLGACITEPNICLLLEFCERGDMKQFLVTRKKMINTHVLHRFATDVARGMKYLHLRLGLVQRDLKTQNLLVDHNYNVKISDFGLTKKEDAKYKTACGTPYYAAPEVIRGEEYDLSADVYSFAIVLWELVTLDEPYGGMDPLQAAMDAATKGVRPKIPFVCPEEYSALMKACWVDKASERPSFADILDRLVDIKKQLFKSDGVSVELHTKSTYDMHSHIQRKADESDSHDESNATTPTHSLHGSSKKDLSMRGDGSSKKDLSINNRASENLSQAGEDAPDNSGKKIEHGMRGSRFLSSVKGSASLDMDGAS